MKLLIIGKTPPPIGGVTIHVKRLMDSLKSSSICFSYIPLAKRNIIKIVHSLVREPVLAHLHSSSPIFRLIFSLMGSLANRSVTIITYHGNLGRHGLIKNMADYFSVRLANVPVVVNEESYRVAKRLNASTRLISAFIPPVTAESIPDSLLDRLIKLNSTYSYVFCTNAFYLAHDRMGRDIYCGTELLRLFCKQNNRCYGFVFSDPSGSYKRHLDHIELKLSPNILLISKNHSFIEILKKCDCFIRCTTTDGDPLSIREALQLDKVVYASNVIERPKGVYTFSCNRMDELQDLIDQIGEIRSKSTTRSEISNSANDLIALYKSFAAIPREMA